MNTTQTIFQQLGANRFAAMTGAKCVADEAAKTLTVHLPRRGLVQITLDETDTYTVKFGKTATMQQLLKGAPLATWKAEHSMVYADGLRALFTAETGLYTSL
jgi:hypothetical protein